MPKIPPNRRRPPRKPTYRQRVATTLNIRRHRKRRNGKGA